MEDFPVEQRPKRPVQPEWLSLYLQCKKYQTLLFEGGLLEQPIEMWQSVTASGEAYEVWLQDRQSEQEEMANALSRQPSGMGRY